MRKLGRDILGAVLGSIAGEGPGLSGGLAWSTTTGIARFKGYSGFGVAWWLLGGIVVNVAAGVWMGVRRGESYLLRLTCFATSPPSRRLLFSTM